jgi:ABC-2 type transport system permease protein
MAYIALVVFYVIFGFLFYTFNVHQYYTADMDGCYFWVTLILVLIAPIFTMGLLAEERRLGTLEGLMTAPVTHTAVVLGKYLAALVLLIVLLLPSGLNIWLLFHYSTAGPDAWRLGAGYLGVFLMGAFMLSFGLFCSSLSRSQTTSALVAVITLFLFWALMFFMGPNPPPTLADDMKEHVFQGLYRAASFVAYERHFEAFISGALDVRDIIFFVSFTVFFLFLSVTVLANRKWR